MRDMKTGGLGSCGRFSPYRWSEVDTTAPGGVFRSRLKDQKRIRQMVRAAYAVNISFSVCAQNKMYLIYKLELLE